MLSSTCRKGSAPFTLRMASIAFQLTPTLSGKVTGMISTNFSACRSFGSARCTMGIVESHVCIGVNPKGVTLQLPKQPLHKDSRLLHPRLASLVQPDRTCSVAAT